MVLSRWGRVREEVVRHTHKPPGPPHQSALGKSTGGQAGPKWAPSEVHVGHSLDEARDSTWTKHMAQPGPGMELNLAQAWGSTWTEDMARLDQAWGSTWDRDRVQTGTRMGLSLDQQQQNIMKLGPWPSFELECPRNMECRQAQLVSIEALSPRRGFCQSHECFTTFDGL